MSESTPNLRRQRMAQRNTLDLRNAAPLPPKAASPAALPRVRRPDIRPADKPKASLTAPTLAPARSTPVGAPASKPRAKPRQYKVVGLLQYPIIAAAAIAAAYSTSFGQWIVLGFVVVAILFRQTSRLSFGAALFVLVTVPLFEIIGQSGIAQNMAVYTFELLVFGVAQAVWETRKLRPS